MAKGRSAQAALVAADAAVASRRGAFRIAKRGIGDWRGAGKPDAGSAAASLGFLTIFLALPVLIFRDLYKYLIRRLLLLKNSGFVPPILALPIGPSGRVYEASGDAVLRRVEAMPSAATTACVECPDSEGTGVGALSETRCELLCGAESFRDAGALFSQREFEAATERPRP